MNNLIPYFIAYLQQKNMIDSVKSNSSKLNSSDSSKCDNYSLNDTLHLTFINGAHDDLLYSAVYNLISDNPIIKNQLQDYVNNFKSIIAVLRKKVENDLEVARESQSEHIAELEAILAELTSNKRVSKTIDLISEAKQTAFYSLSAENQELISQTIDALSFSLLSLTDGAFSQLASKTQFKRDKFNVISEVYDDITLKVLDNAKKQYLNKSQSESQPNNE